MNNRVNLRALRHSTTINTKTEFQSLFSLKTQPWLYQYYISEYVNRLVKIEKSYKSTAFDIQKKVKKELLKNKMFLSSFEDKSKPDLKSKISKKDDSKLDLRSKVSKKDKSKPDLKSKVSKKDDLIFGRSLHPNEILVEDLKKQTLEILNKRQKKYVKKIYKTQETNPIIIGDIQLNYYGNILYVCYQEYWDKSLLTTAELHRMSIRLKVGQKHLSQILGLTVLFKSSNIMEPLWEAELLYGRKKKRVNQQYGLNSIEKKSPDKTTWGIDAFQKETIEKEIEMSRKMDTLREIYRKYVQFQKILYKRYKKNEYYRRLHKILFSLTIKAKVDLHILTKAIAYEFSILKGGHSAFVNFLVKALEEFMYINPTLHIQNMRLQIKGRMVSANRQTPRKKIENLFFGTKQKNGSYRLFKDECSALAVSKFGCINVRMSIGYITQQLICINKESKYQSFKSDILTRKSFDVNSGNYSELNSINSLHLLKLFLLNNWFIKRHYIEKYLANHSQVYNKNRIDNLIVKKKKKITHIRQQIKEEIFYQERLNMGLCIPTGLVVNRYLNKKYI